MNLTEDYCSFELTKLLLEKGCPLEKVRRQDGRPVYYTLPKDHPNWADCDAYYILTHAQVMKWLREKGIFVLPDVRSADGKWFCMIVRRFEEADNGCTGERRAMGYYDTYEEAVEAALKYVLEKFELSTEEFNPYKE